MSLHTDTQTADESIDECELTQSERNRFFHGKLMTARDMAAEQRYHRNLFTRRSRYIAGYGVVDGLSADVERVDDGLVVTIASGYALDCCGRPVVVPRERTIPIEEVPDAERLDVVISYEECVTETVPVPNSEDACERECAYNRIIETFDVDLDRSEGTEALRKPVPSLEFPEKAAFEGEGGRPEEMEALLEELNELRAAREQAIEAGDEARAQDLAQEIEEVEEHLEEIEDGERSRPTGSEIDDRHRELGRLARTWDPDDSLPIECPEDGSHEIYVGTVAPPAEGVESVDAAVQPRVYPNDLLYAAIARHTADFENPHEVTAAQVEALRSVKGVSNPGGDVDLMSVDEAISFTTDPDVVGENTVGMSVPGLVGLGEELEEHLDDADNPHDVTAAQTGGIRSVSGVAGGAEGNVRLVALDEQISVVVDDERLDDHEVGLEVTGLGELEERIEDLEDQHREDIEELTDRLHRTERYVMERSVSRTCRAMSIVIERFDNVDVAARIAQLSRDQLADLEAGEVLDPNDYEAYIGSVIQPQQQLHGIIEDQGGPHESLGRALDDLATAHDNYADQDVLPMAAAQLEALDLFACARVIEIE